jgi:flagellar hook-length control protein FliK
MSSPTEAFDVAAVVDALNRDADLSRAAHRHAVEVHDFETGVETNIANHVAKTSSRSSNDIRDLMKLGVRDIEIIQGTGSAQTMNVSPQVQTNELVGASTPARAQVTDAFAPTSQEANAADRRAQAHEIRMRAIERQVVAAVRDGADTIRMQLYPPGLGQIIIRLTMDGSKLKLTTSANSSDAADSLRSIEGDLREALSVGGLELTGFDVSEDGEGGHKNHKNTSETDTNIQQTRSAKSDDFALDMNA